MKIKLIIVAVFFIFFYSNSYAEKEVQPYRHLMVLGPDMNFSSSKDDPLSPIVAYFYYKEDLPSDLYLQFTLLTTSVFFIAGQKTEQYFFGLRPALNHSIYGGYALFNDGVLQKDRIYSGSNSGGEIFFKYFPVKKISAAVYNYYAYYFYSRKTLENLLYSTSPQTRIGLPSNHLENTASLEFIYKDYDEKSIGRIKHGVFLKGLYSYSRRFGYGRFEDISGKSSDIVSYHKFFAEAGFYYNYRDIVNLQVDINGSLQRNIDRNSADLLGSYTSDNGAIPGYYFGEFIHNRFILSRIKSAFSLKFWETVIAPAFNILYMPKDNHVTGIDNYSKTVYSSLSFSISTMAGGLLPVFLNYGYGMDAKRKNAENGNTYSGSHELFVYVLMAFGENK